MARPVNHGNFHVSTIAAVLLLALARPPITLAQVKPGDFINAESAAKVQDLVSPGVYFKVKNGMTMKIMPGRRITWPPPYWEATEKYSVQVRLSEDNRSLVGYVAGQPFPLLDSNDPNFAVKIMWNNVFRPIVSDDYDLRFFDCESVQSRRGAASSVVNYIQIGHYAGYNLVGRTEVEPMPVDPDFNVSGRLWAFALYPQLAPAEQRGTGLLRYRYADSGKADDAWSWNPGNRRLRRLNEGFLSSAVGAQTFDPDHYSGFNAKTEEYQYRFLAEGEMLAVAHAENSTEVRCNTDGGGSACPEAWEARHLYTIEATPRPELMSQALQGKSILYIDSEMWFAPYVDTYNRDGQLFQNVLFWLAYRDRTVPEARVAIYPFKRQFVVGASRTDLQSGSATMCYLPGIETPERECWYINMGAIGRSFFTTRAMANAAP
jgi:Protein of unknown function (DUF1329)